MHKPYCPGHKITFDEDQKTPEIDRISMDTILSKADRLQREAAAIPLSVRLKTIEEMGKAWKRKWESGELKEVAENLAMNTGYSPEVIKLEMAFVSEVLDPVKMMKNLDSTLRGGAESLERIVEIADGEHIRNHPCGPALIISSGNSLVPPFIPTISSLMTGNVTILKPSLANYEAVVAVISTLEEAVEKTGAKPLLDLLVVSYMSHNSPLLDYLLSNARIGVVNFWGGDPARGEVSAKVASNPHMPRYFANGPLTGFGVIDKDSATDEAAHGLALNILLYDQQLCSSPTQAAFIGPMDAAKSFCEKVSKHLDEIGRNMPMGISHDGAFILQCARKYVQFAGAKIFSSDDLQNMWTISLSESVSDLDDASQSYGPLAFHNRRRFLEVVRVDDAEQVIELISDLPMNNAYRGADKVQTVGLALSKVNLGSVVPMLPSTGAYRLVPIDDMFMRSPLEPYDGMDMAKLFTYGVYLRDRSLGREVLR